MPGEHGQVLTDRIVAPSGRWLNGPPSSARPSPTRSRRRSTRPGTARSAWTTGTTPAPTWPSTSWSRFVAGLGPEWRGLSLTRPLKEVAFEVATTVSDVARDTGSINTLLRRPDGGWNKTN